MLTIIRVQTFLIMLFFPMFLNAQSSNTSSITTLNQFGALELANQVNKEALKLDKKVSLAILGASGEVILLLKGDGVGPHNTKASERKAFTALSTKTVSLELMYKFVESKDAKNLNTIPELLLLGGRVPIWQNGQLIGSLGVSGGGGGENDHQIAVNAIEKLNFATHN